MFSSGEATMSDPAGDGLPFHAAHNRRPVLRAGILTAAAALGAMVPAVLPVDLSRNYTAETRIELASLSKGEEQAFLAKARHNLGTPSFLDGALQKIATSLPVSPDQREQTAFGFLSDLATRRDVRPSATESLARSRLAEQVVLVDGGQDRRLTVAVRDPDLERAVVSANTIADLLVSADHDHASLETSAVRNARQSLEKVQAELESLAVPDQDLQALKTQESALSDLAAEGAALDASQAALQQKASLLSELQPQSIVQNAVPDELAGTGLEEARRRYQDAKLEVDQLSVSLGPRHPRLVAAKATEDEARAAISTSLQRAAGGVKQQLDGVKAQLQDLAKRRTDLEAQPVSEAARKRLALESQLESARLVYLDTLRGAEQAPPSAPSLTRLDRATVDTAEASGLPAWLYALISGLAAACLAGAALPGRSTEDEDADLPAVAAAPHRATDVEPRFVDLPAPVHRAQPEAIRFASPADLGVEQPAEETPSLAAMDRAAEPVHPKMPSFDEYYQPKPASSSRSFNLEQVTARVANDTGPVGLRDEMLLRTLISNRTVVSPQQPLPQLLASILSRRQLETQAEALPVQTAEEREMQDLKREIEALRRQVEEQLADREPSVQPRYAVAR
jgi:uncharacterized protein involved in exopolysaccharide biosynthesis